MNIDLRDVCPEKFFLLLECHLIPSLFLPDIDVDNWQWLNGINTKDWEHLPDWNYVYLKPVEIRHLMLIILIFPLLIHRMHIYNVAAVAKGTTSHIGSSFKDIPRWFSCQYDSIHCQETIHAASLGIIAKQSINRSNFIRTYTTHQHANQHQK